MIPDHFPNSDVSPRFRRRLRLRAGAFLKMLNVLMEGGIWGEEFNGI